MFVGKVYFENLARYYTFIIAFLIPKPCTCKFDAREIKRGSYCEA